MERATGRNRSEIGDLDRRIRALDEELAGAGPELEIRLRDAAFSAENPRALESAARAFLFTLEAYAWALLQRLRAELFEKRLGMPDNDAEVFSILQKSGAVDLVESRKLRQFCEVRHLSSRDLSKIDLPGVLGQTHENLSEMRAILARISSAGVR